MDNRVEVREFLTSRRAKITQQQAGMPDVGVRRVPGLRRGEVAALAGVSVEYYSKLERGAIGGVSASVLDAIARALQLDERLSSFLCKRLLILWLGAGSSAVECVPVLAAVKLGRHGRPGRWVDRGCAPARLA